MSELLKKIMIVVGTRPEIIKMSPIIREIVKQNIDLIIVHTGQHYDFELSQVFFEDLKLPKIDYNLEIGSGSHAQQLSSIISKLEKPISTNNPDIVLAEGDTNSVLATALVCNKANIPFGHVEAGIRSFDMTMPEQVNRKITAVVSHLNFAPSERAFINLLSEGIERNRIFLTGNTIVDATIQNLKLSINTHFEELDELYDFIDESPFILCTIHRPSNVDFKEKLVEIMKSFSTLSKQNLKIIFPMHPRTKSNLIKFQIYEDFSKINNLFICKPLAYLPFLQLMNKCSLILTDSGGIQEEAISLNKECLTLRENTERPETIEIGLNELCPTESDIIIEKITKKIFNGTNDLSLREIKNPYGEGDAAKKILAIIRDKINIAKFQSPSYLKIGSPSFRIHRINENMKLNDFREKEEKISMIFDEKGNPLATIDELKKGYLVIKLNNRE